MDFVAHLGTWLKKSPYAAGYAFVDDPLSNYSLPTEQTFWDDLFHNATHGPRGWATLIPAAAPSAPRTTPFLEKTPILGVKYGCLP